MKIKDATHAREILKRLAHLDISVDHFEIVEPSLHQIYLDRMGR
ncbi:ATP-binding protein DrrA1-3 family domain-containing protein [Alicyclobacillus mali (ex Roth et al. 2021)]